MKRGKATTAGAVLPAPVRTSVRAWHGGSSKAGPGIQIGAVALRRLPAAELAALHVAPECGCGSHTGRECPDCGALYCDAPGHPRHVCLETLPGDPCLRCRGSGRLAGGTRGVAWVEWVERTRRPDGGRRELGVIRFRPPVAALDAVDAVACHACKGTGRVQA